MKIVIASCAVADCGIGRYDEELTKALHQSGEDVTLYRKTPGTVPYIKSYPYRCFRELRHYVAPYYLSKAIRNENPDVFLADYVDAGYAIGISGKKPKAIVTTAHDAIPFIYKQKPVDFWFYKFQLAKTLKISDSIVVVSQKSKDDFVFYTGCSPERVQVIYNGINHKFFYPDLVRKPNSIFTIRYVGGLSKHKNVEVIIRTAKILQDRNIPVKFELGGGYPQSTPLPALATELGLRNVEFKGFIPDSELRSFLAGADLFVYPSLYEGFGFPPLESMACGTPVVASEKGSLSEVLKNGAVTLDPDPEAFADAIEKIAGDTVKWNLLRANGLQVANSYSWEKAASETLGLFQSLTGVR